MLINIDKLSTILKTSTLKQPKDKVEPFLANKVSASKQMPNTDESIQLSSIIILIDPKADIIILDT